MWGMRQGRPCGRLSRRAGAPGLPPPAASPQGAPLRRLPDEARRTVASRRLALRWEPCRSFGGKRGRTGHGARRWGARPAQSSHSAGGGVVLYTAAR